MDSNPPRSPRSRSRSRSRFADLQSRIARVIKKLEFEEQLQLEELELLASIADADADIDGEDPQEPHDDNSDASSHQSATLTSEGEFRFDEAESTDAAPAARAIRPSKTTPSKSTGKSRKKQRFAGEIECQG